MKRNSRTLDKIFISNPCSTDWDSMTGSRRMRFCQQCNKNVYNLSAMTRDEAEAVIAHFKGRLCARLERDEDGVIWTDDMQAADMRAAPQLISRRASPVAAALVTALLGLGGSVMAITPNASAPVAIHLSSNQDDRAPQPQGSTATITGEVTDSSGAVIANAKVTLINQATGQPCGTTTSGDEGAYSFASLAEGTYTIRAEYQNFKTTQITDVEIRAGQSMRADFILIDSGQAVTMGLVSAPPQPLRALHHNSDLIVVARLGRSTTVETDDTINMMKSTLDVMAVIKGDSRQSHITLYNWGWEEDSKLPGSFKSGDTALFFLKPRDDGDGFELNDYESSVKLLAPADLSVYRQRLEELNAMAKAEKPDTAAMVEWLVRCAEQPATRWEGVYDLARGGEGDTNQRDAKASDKADAPEAVIPATTVNPTATSEPASSSDAKAEPAASSCSKPGDSPRFAAMLSEQQKDRLKAVLFNIDALTDDDMELVKLVQQWNDARFVPFLLDQLRRLEANPPYLAARLVETVSDLLQDEEVKALAEEYKDKASYKDLEAEAEAVYRQAEAAGSPEAEATAEIMAKAETSHEADDTEKDAATARQERSRMLQHFIAMAEKKGAGQRLN